MKVKRSDAFRTCLRVNGGCRCEGRGNPCLSWVYPLQICRAWGIDPAQAEVDRIEMNRRNNGFETLPMSAGRAIAAQTQARKGEEEE